MSYFIVIQTETYALHNYIKTAEIDLWYNSVKKSIDLIPKSFYGCQNKFTPYISFSELLCLPPGDPRTLRT